MFLHVTKARPLDGYRVEVCFDDGRQGVADLTGALEGPVFEPLKKPEAFRKFRVDEELRTIVGPTEWTWPRNTSTTRHSETIRNCKPPSANGLHRIGLQGEAAQPQVVELLKEPATKAITRTWNPGRKELQYE